MQRVTAANGEKGAVEISDRSSSSSILLIAAPWVELRLHSPVPREVSFPLTFLGWPR